ncbi:hypothetical protein LOTGIDRAFT_234616 [Lottia gigantea]|uniref:Stathmin n=1 Tax=Lottia gigantea TaxID=225164 RepID=V4BHL1_LOTGI|nr:hypothetical protein LOTGIDRAFT_234616 [Lottia gigantea]ESO88289.1 hypothetical protein LOTGIDRAFT_234616 [Lottia gigantea]
MGGLFSSCRKPTERKNVRNIQVLPVGNADGHSQKTDYGVFCVSNTKSVKNSSTGETSDAQTKSSSPTEDFKLEEEEDSVSEEGKKECPPEKGVAPESLGVKKLSEENVKTILVQEGLVTNLKGLSSKGLAFEIVEKSRDDVVPPARLEEIIKSREKRAEPTVEEIKKKLFEAERRRKQLEEERIIRVRAMKKTETAGAIKAYEQKQKALEDQQTQKMDVAVAARQNHLREIRDKLKEKRRHANLVRQRKNLNLDDMDPPPPEEPRFRFHHN